jgi:hypothetical protein
VNLQVHTQEKKVSWMRSTETYWIYVQLGLGFGETKSIVHLGECLYKVETPLIERLRNSKSWKP